MTTEAMTPHEKELALSALVLRAELAAKRRDGAEVRATKAWMKEIISASLLRPSAV